MRDHTFLDFRPPKSPKRFFLPFSPSKSQQQPPPPLPPLPPFPSYPLPSPPTNYTPSTPYTPTTPSRKSHTPSSSTSSIQGLGLGCGAQVVRTPSEALRGVRHHPSASKKGTAEVKSPGMGNGMSSMEELRQSRCVKPVLRHQKSDIHPSKKDLSYTQTQQYTNYDSDYGTSYAHLQSANNARKHQSINPRKGSSRRDEIENYYLNSKSSISSISSVLSPMTPSPSASPYRGRGDLDDDDDATITKKKYHQSMIPSSSRDVTPKVDSLAHLSTFDPFGTSSPSSFSSFASPRTPISASSMVIDRKARRSTLKPALKPITREERVLHPFSAILVGKTIKPSPTIENTILVTLQFGFSTEDPPKNDSVTIPWDTLRKVQGYLVDWLEGLIPPEEKEGGKTEPEMTDGSSAEESDLDSEYDLNNLLRDEYLKSLFIADPSDLDIPLPSLPKHTQTKSLRPTPRTTAGLSIQPRKRALTRNQYTQLIPHPSPLSPYTAPIPGLSARRNVPALKVQAEEINGGGSIITYTVLLSRDASAYHMIIGRLSVGYWGRGMDSGKRRKVEDECKWLGMEGLVRELEALKQKSLVRRGGEGYI